MDIQAIDAHAHCGVQDRFPPQSFDDYLSHVRGSPIKGAVLFSPVMEIYDRYDPGFEDDAAWQEGRRRSNDYLITLDGPDFQVFPYYFIWNDFDVDRLASEHKGIKWHRHADEPRYHYDDPRCARAIDEIRRRKMPVCLEEEREHTLRFVNELAVGVRIVIPHLGFLNGGYEALRRSGVWENPNIFADTSLASTPQIMDYVNRYGHERLMFGSDFPFGDPVRELEKVRKLPLPHEAKAAVLEGNIRRLLADSNCQP